MTRPSFRFAHAIAERYRRWRFGHVVKQVAEVAEPRLAGDSTITLLSMVNHRDTHAYLLAAQTLMRRVPVRKVIVVADPSLDEADKALIAASIPAVEFIEARTGRQAGLPVGGTWERLVTISHEVRDGYVIQMDADTVTLGDLPEVILAAKANRAFLLASSGGLQISPLEDAVAAARPKAQRIQHVQIQAEANFDALDAARWRYVRACSGFAGFPRGSFNVDKLLELSAAMSARLGSRWSDWGSEQVASNLICASQPDALLLPNPKYCNADFEAPDTAFLHFIGYTRFTTPRYRQVAAQVIRDMRQSR